MSTSTTHLRVVIVPGNGCTSNIRKSNWYGFAEDKLKMSGQFTQVVLEVMPDPIEAKESVWVPHMLNALKADEKTIVIGHSSGAEACMRLLEDHKIFGAVLVSACYSDMGEPSEAIAGYYNRPWQWDKIAQNVNPKFGILQVHSRDDPFIPVEEAQHVAENLGSDFQLFEDRSHFFDSESISDILDMVIEKVKGV